MPDGVFQTDRAIFGNRIWKHPLKFRLFFFIYGNAVYSETGVDIGDIHVSRGQFLRSFRNLQEDLEYIENNAVKRPSLSQIKKHVDELIEEKRVTIQSTTLGTLFTVLNYEQYQGFERFNEDNLERRKNGERTEKERSPNNNKKDNKDNKDKNLKDIYTHFIPPTLEEVKAYCLERNNKVDPEKWHDFYSSKGWMVGKNKMKDWKAAVRTWEKSDSSNKPPGKAKPINTGNFDQRDYDDEFYNSLYKNVREVKKDE
ncbi:MAG: hypothetical protein ACM3TR_09660 [Caulobacteraceae bacterium]